MIKKIIFPLLAIILLGSCANKFSIQKRKYNKGFYIAGSKSNSIKNNKFKSAELKANPTATEGAVTELVQTEIVKAPINNETIMVVSKTEELKPVVSSKYNKTITASVNTPIIISEKEFKKLSEKSISSTNPVKKGSSDANLIVLIILSLFPILCLIAVFIHDGHKITMNFWIDLLLHLTVIGEIIFAILVVLDVVDLS